MSSRAIAGTLLAAAGAVIAVAGPRTLLDMARWSVQHGGVLLLWLAGMVALWTAVPAGKRKWPALLAGAGLLVLLLQRGVDPSIIAGGGLVALGALISAVRLPAAFRDDVIDPVHTYRRVGFYARNIVAEPVHEVPSQIRLLSMATCTELNLKDAQPSTSDVLELVLTCWFSRVRITLPPQWAVVAGRVTATKFVTFKGTLDSSDLIIDLDDPIDAEKLTGIAQKRSTMVMNSADNQPVGVVIHVAGAVSRVTLCR
jgi:hypothetical protein